MIASSMRRLLWCRTRRSRSAGARSCSASSERIVARDGVDGEVPDLGAVHGEGVEALLEHLRADGQARAAARDLDESAAAPVAAQVEVESPVVAGRTGTAAPRRRRRRRRRRSAGRFQFMIFENASVPMTSAFRYRWAAVSIMLCATLSANTNPAQTEFTSKAGHWPSATPSFSCTMQATAGCDWSGVAQATTMRSTSDLSTPALRQAAPGRLRTPCRWGPPSAPQTPPFDDPRLGGDPLVRRVDSPSPARCWSPSSRNVAPDA